MQDVLSILSDIRRPRLLIQAARVGSEQYERSLHLPRILGFGASRKGSSVLLCLIEMESELNRRRRDDDASYSISRHVDVLSAMMGEARLLRNMRAKAGAVIGQPA